MMAGRGCSSASQPRSQLRAKSSNKFKAIKDDYFVSVFTTEHVVDLKELHCHLPSKAFHLNTIIISPSEVFEELSTLDPHKACGPDRYAKRQSL